jgi:hypothetical protein
MRARLFLAIAAIMGAAFVLIGCVHRPPPVWTYYDDCAAKTPSFVAMVACGKEKRSAVCAVPENARFCGPESTAFVQYADGLAQSVQNHEISDGVALQRFAEYKSSLFQGIRHDQATIAAGEAAGAAASRPRTCTAIGNTVNCY